MQHNVAKLASVSTLEVGESFELPSTICSAFSNDLQRQTTSTPILNDDGFTSANNTQSGAETVTRCSTPERTVVNQLQDAQDDAGNPTTVVSPVGDPSDMRGAGKREEENLKLRR